MENLQLTKRDSPLILHRTSASSPGPVRCHMTVVLPSTVLISLMTCAKQCRLSSIKLKIAVVVCVNELPYVYRYIAQAMDPDPHAI